MTITNANTTHAEDGRGFTLCGLKIGEPRDWRHVSNVAGPEKVSCRVCLVAEKQAKEHGAFNDLLKQAQKETE